MPSLMKMHTTVQSLSCSQGYYYESIVTLTFDLWPPKSIGFILSPWLTYQPIQRRCTKWFSLHCVHKAISMYVHCDLNFWLLTKEINRVHPLIIVNMSAKFDRDTHNGSVAIVRFQVPGTRPFKTLILHARLRTSRTLPLFYDIISN